MATIRTAPTLADIQEARERIQGIAEVTPIYLSETFSRRAGREVRLKAENLQRTGAFKIRGAVNKLATLSAAERAAGVVAASAGNHGQAVAWAARELGVRARIFVPLDGPRRRARRSSIRTRTSSSLPGKERSGSSCSSRRRMSAPC
jgi:threonine dehydratase